MTIQLYKSQVVIVRKFCEEIAKAYYIAGVIGSITFPGLEGKVRMFIIGLVFSMGFLYTALYIAKEIHELL